MLSRPRCEIGGSGADVLAREEAAVVDARNELPELETIDEERRLYPRDGFAAHLIGYVGELSEEDLNKPKYAYYEPGDVVGKAGVGVGVSGAVGNWNKPARGPVRVGHKD